MGKKRTVYLNNIWKDHGVRKEVKLRLVRAIVWPVMLYGAEAWTIRASDAKRMEAAEMWVYRKLLQVTWRDRITTENILHSLGIKRELLALVKKRKLAFFGHVCRGEGLTRDLIAGYHPGKRRRGRPRRQYIDYVKAWTNSTMVQAIRRTVDRDKWRVLVKRAAEGGPSSIPGTP